MVLIFSSIENFIPQVTKLILDPQQPRLTEQYSKFELNDGKASRKTKENQASPINLPLQRSTLIAETGISQIREPEGRPPMCFNVTI
ncbi:hypothetical protein TWF506_002020 [Arthrobotrys conoides]|uniref:Uncharacterized protein n=1 Tax=Arthrobotrys conoides TaxID=74498 RepID=A0AAN8P3V4_9PEZI